MARRWKGAPSRPMCSGEARVQGPRACKSSFQGVKTKFSCVISHSYRDSHGTSPYVSEGQLFPSWEEPEEPRSGICLQATHQPCSGPPLPPTPTQGEILVSEELHVLQQ